MKYNTNIKIIFPENTVLIIAKIMKKYGVAEKRETIFEKLEKQETTNAKKIAKIIKKAAEEKAPIKTISSNIQKHLKIPTKQAKKMAQEIQKNILNLVKETLVKGEEINEKPIKTIPNKFSIKKSKEEQNPDAYRETIK
ncbi:hypothetical protein KAW43_02735 [Candidatus Parcubacteria bacterium]|nr:hypothetical protein [Candidatus Parcubacteria bacterium]